MQSILKAGVVMSALVLLLLAALPTRVQDRSASQGELSVTMLELPARGVVFIPIPGLGGLTAPVAYSLVPAPRTGPIDGVLFCIRDASGMLRTTAPPPVVRDQAWLLARWCERQRLSP